MPITKKPTGKNLKKKIVRISKKANFVTLFTINRTIFYKYLFNGLNDNYTLMYTEQSNWLKFLK